MNWKFKYTKRFFFTKDECVAVSNNEPLKTDTSCDGQQSLVQNEPPEFGNFDTSELVPVKRDKQN